MLDLLIINGHVIDPANHIDEVRPVAVFDFAKSPYGQTLKNVADDKLQY